MKKVLVGILVVVVAGIAAVAFLVNKTSKELRPLAEDLLHQLDTGAVADVYAAASSKFREATSRDDFERYVAFRHTALGAFQRVTATTGAGASTSTSSGTTGVVHLTLAYERGETKGDFDFVKEDGAWKLLGFKVVIPEQLAPKADRALVQPLGEELLGLLQRQQIVALYQRFSSALQKVWPAEKFQTDMDAFRTRMGNMRSPKFQALEDVEGGHVVAQFEVPFEKGTGDARIKCEWDGLAWQVVGFEIHQR